MGFIKNGVFCAFILSIIFTAISSQAEVIPVCLGSHGHQIEVESSEHKPVNVPPIHHQHQNHSQGEEEEETEKSEEFISKHNLFTIDQTISTKNKHCTYLEDLYTNPHRDAITRPPIV